MDKISIIVPVYKVEDYLENCVNSLLNQSYINIEIVLVDDGSPDSCPKLCENYARVDSRVKVIHKENGGLSSARNAGIVAATGKYITFIDSDDYVNIHYIEILVNAMQRYDTDIAVCSYDIVSPEKVNSEDVISELEYKKMSRDEFIETALYGKGFSVSAWGKLYKRSMFSELRYMEGILYEDLQIFPHIAKMIYSAVYVDAKLYYYTIRPNSIINSKFTMRKLDYINMAKLCKEELQPIFGGEVLDIKVLKAYADVAIDINIPNDEKENEVLVECKRFVRKQGLKHIFNRKLEKKYRLFILFNLFGMNRMFVRIYKVYMKRS